MTARTEPTELAGNKGQEGAQGRDAPTLIIIANEILRQDGTVPPTFADVVLDTRGQNGQDGQDGQNGQDGGNGGSGGAGISGIGCEVSPGSGGNGGWGGTPGRGGFGGDGGRGGDVYLGGSATVMDLLSFAKINANGGAGGTDGAKGEDGRPGAGGPRGPNSRLCSGGSPGQDGGAYTNEWTLMKGIFGRSGLVHYTPLDAATLFNP
jgi:hypothetical protein